MVLEAEVLLEVDGRAEDAERLALNGHLGARVPEAGPALDDEALADRRVVAGWRGRGQHACARATTEARTDRAQAIVHGR